ncbi:MAG: N-acetylglucosamine-6-phosphate deacetylase [Anaerolineae bacterium]|jgi:N-acetylglucosamine-6-phosphate deacetylase
MSITLYLAQIFTPGEVEADTIVVSDDGTIAYVGPVEMAPPVNGPRLDMRGLAVVPGFIDIHTHGGHGVTFGAIESLEEDLRHYSGWVASTGVTGFLCTVAAPDARSLLDLVSAYVELFEAGGWQGARPLGLHLEGPFLSSDKKGAFNPRWLRKPAIEEAEAVLEAERGWIRQMTLAPELSGADEIAALFRGEGVVVSLGHTNANYETASAALKGNFTHVTHTFNAQRGFHHRDPGVFGAILASDCVTAELIADTIHVHPGAMTMLLRCLGPDRVVLITDAMAGAGLADGEYDLVGHSVTVRDGKATLADGTIAGSAATMNMCVRNLHREVGVPLADAAKMASLNPARTLGLAGALGSLRVGQPANLIAVDDDVNVKMTMVDGAIVYQEF